MLVCPAYIVQSCLYGLVALLSMIIGALLLKAEQKPWNLYKARAPLVRIFHIATILVSGALLVLSVDISGAFHVYPVTIILILKDTITSILVACALCWLHVILHVVFPSSNASPAEALSDQRASRPSFLFVSIPAGLNVALAMISTLLAVRNNRETYRAIWMLFLGVLLICVASATLVCLLIYSAVRSSTRTEVDSRLWVKLLVATIGFTCTGGLELLIAIRVVLQNQRLIEAQIRDPLVFTPFWEGVLFVAGLFLIVYSSWIPLQEPLRFSEARFGLFQNREHADRVVFFPATQQTSIVGINDRERLGSVQSKEEISPLLHPT